MHTKKVLEKAVLISEPMISGSLLTKKILAKSSFGSFVRGIRQSDGLTQTELAKRLGCTRQYINAIESDRQEVGIETATRIGTALGYGPLTFLEVLIRTQLSRAGLSVKVALKAV